MKLHTAALALVVWLMMPLPLAAAGPAAVPGAADVLPAPAWDLLLPPLRPLFGPAPPGDRPVETDLKAPLSRWIIIKTFPTEKKCREQASDALADYRFKKEAEILAPMGYRFQLLRDVRNLKEEQTLRCVATDDPRLKE